MAALHQSLTASFSVRALQHQDEKRRIARATLGFIVPGETIILDAGSTVVELSNLISNPEELTVVTPALNIAMQLGSLPGVEVITVGGKLDAQTISNVGPIAEMQLQSVLAHKLFLGVYAIDRRETWPNRSRRSPASRGRWSKPLARWSCWLTRPNGTRARPGQKSLA